MICKEGACTELLYIIDCTAELLLLLLTLSCIVEHLRGFHWAILDWHCGTLVDVLVRQTIRD
jgi:hypothetical protein